ncbi:PEP/pyruvate-binding domain-containing protein, partial [Undibacterium sp. 5I1]|uniref:PEP/pyruvate-binding domain-containing protein n=1 Tax=Undibacterium sp. 5I1 TaxID=3048590 RepID=UPI002B23C00C
MEPATPAVTATPASHAAYIQFFDGGLPPLHEQLGGKCASLVALTAAGMPVPPGFAITTAAYD